MRWTAYFNDVHGRRHCAGTFATKRAADKAWQDAEADSRAGRAGDPHAGRIRFKTYVEDIWFPNHVIEASTRESYRYNLNRHIVPWFGTMKMRDIMPLHVGEWVTDLIAQEITPATIRHQRILLSAIFTTALNDSVVTLHPCKGVKTPTVPVKEYRILTPQEISALLAALPCDAARLLVEVAIEAGLRWGELTELHPVDLDTRTGVLTVSRAVVEISPDDHPTGDRFLVKLYPKSKRSRRFGLDPAVVALLVEHIKQHELGPDDLLFDAALFTGPKSAPPLIDVVDLGRTDPNAAGKTYPHGSLSAYTAGWCRCQHCRTAFAAYRSARRAAGVDSPRGSRRERETDGHLSRDWWRHQVWTPACAAAGIHPRPRMHDPSALPCLLAAGRGSGPPDRPRTPRPPVDRHY